MQVEGTGELELLGEFGATQRGTHWSGGDIITREVDVVTRELKSDTVRKQRWTSEHSQFTLRRPSLSRRWKLQFLDAIFTVIAQAIVGLFFTVSKVACGECRLGTLGVLFLQPGEDLENEHETVFGWSVNFFILSCYSLHRRNYTIITTDTLRRLQTDRGTPKDETRLTSSSFSSSASSLVIYPSFTSPSLGSGASQ